MNSTLLAVILVAIILLLVLTRRKSGRGGTRSGRHAPCGFGRRGSARSGKSPAGNGFDGAGYWNARGVKFRQEDRPPVDARKARGLEAALADDIHGKFGEAATSALVARAAFGDKRKHYILQNVFIPTHTGYTEIDTVLLHVTGIYVFETKNISGEIEGDLDVERWNQELGPRVHHTLYNPIRQNTGHMGALLRQLKVRLESAPSWCSATGVRSGTCLPAGSLVATGTDGRCFTCANCAMPLMRHSARVPRFTMPACWNRGGRRCSPA